MGEFFNLKSGGFRFGAKCVLYIMLFENDSESEHPMPNTALLSTVMCLGTFGVAYLFRQIRTSRYFNPMVKIANCIIMKVIFYISACNYE